MPDKNDTQQAQEPTDGAANEIEHTPDENFASEDKEIEPQDSSPKPIETNTAETVLARAPHHKTARDAEPFDFERCTVLVMLQIAPLREGQSPYERKVFISARTHSYPPYLKQMRWDELAPRLPNEINALLEGVKEELPRRAAEQHTLDEAERQRQAQLQAESANRRAANKEKSNSANAKGKRSKHVDLNAPPTLTNEISAPPTETAPAEPQAPLETEPSAQMAMF